MPSSTNKGRRFPHWKNGTFREQNVQAFYEDGNFRAVVYRRKGEENPWQWNIFISNNWLLATGYDDRLPQAKYAAVEELNKVKHAVLDTE